MTVQHMLNILQGIFYGKPFLLMLLTCDGPLSLDLPGYHFQQQQPCTLQVLDFHPVLVDITNLSRYCNKRDKSAAGSVRLGAAGLLRVRACAQACMFVGGYVPNEIR